MSDYNVTTVDRFGKKQRFTIPEVNGFGTLPVEKVAELLREDHKDLIDDPEITTTVCWTDRLEILEVYVYSRFTKDLVLVM